FNNKSILNYSSSAVPSKSPAEGKGHLEKIPNESDMTVLKNETEDKSEENQDESLDRILHDVKTYLNDHDLNDAISGNRSERDFVLVLQYRMLFDAGEAAIPDSGKSFLGEIGGLLSEMPNNIQVVGHTDNRPIIYLL